MSTRGITFREIVLLAALSVACGALYIGWAPVYFAASAVHPALGQLLYGMWFIASTVAAYVIQKPGVAFVAELAGAAAEFLFGSPWSLQVLVYGAVQGLGAELVLAAFRYRRFDLTALALAGVGAAVGSLPVDYAFGYLDLEQLSLAATVAARLLGGALLAGVLGKAVVDALVRTGVLNAYPVARRRVASHGGRAA